MIPKTAFGYKVAPGKLYLADGTEVEIEMETWSATPEGPVYVGEISFGLDTPDFYRMAEVHASAERFLQRTLGQGVGDLSFPDSPSWLGSKVRVLLNLPLE